MAWYDKTGGNVSETSKHFAKTEFRKYRANYIKEMIYVVVNE